MRTRADEEQAGPLLSNLSNYTLRTPLNSHDTLDLGERQPPGVTVRALLALEPDAPADHFEMLGQRYGLLLLVGITTAELTAFRGGRADEALSLLRERDVYPFTSLRRESVV